MEIERKFLIDKLPDLPVLSHKTVYQGYLYTAPIALRIRKTTDFATGENKYILCVKSGGTLARTEVETVLTAEQFCELEALLDKPLIKKDYYTYEIGGGLILECSVVDDGVFSYREVEFKDISQAENWQPLEFLGRELTYMKGFTMAEYWQNRTLPNFYDIK